jgi:hypothetical protein
MTLVLKNRSMSLWLESQAEERLGRNKAMRM